MANIQPIHAAGDRRVAERRSALDVYLCLVDLGENRNAMLLDVSETGIGVQSVGAASEGLATTFRFQLPDTAVLVEGEGEIAWADRAGRMGIRFTRIAPELKPELRNWVVSEANPMFADQPDTEEIADLDARDRVAQLEARIIVSGWAQIQALNFLVDQIAAMTQASGVAIAVEDGNGIVCKASSGIAPQAGVRVDQRSGLSWECVRAGEVVQCADTENDPRVDRMVCRQLNMRSAMLVPVKKDRRVAGLVEVFSSRPHAFSNQTAILLKRVAEAVASLDETAPDVSAESARLTPPAAQPIARPAVETIAPPKPAEPEKKIPVAIPAASVPKPISQTLPPNLVEVPQAPPVMAPRPAAAATSAPPAMPPTPTPRPAVAPAATKIGIPFAQEEAVATKPAVVATAPPVVAKPIEKPAPAEKYIAFERPVTPPPVVVKEVERLAKPVVERIEIPLPPSPPKEKPVVVERSMEAAPSLTRVLATPATLPEVTFSGAEAPATAKMSPAIDVPVYPSAWKEEKVGVGDRAFAEVADRPFAALSEAAPDRRGMYIGVVVAVMIVVSALGGWYWAHVKSASKKAAVNTQATKTQATNAPATKALLPVVLPNAPAALTGARPGAVVPPKPGIGPAATKTEPAKPSPAQPARNAPVQSDDNTQITAATFIPPGEPKPSAPPLAPTIAIAPPNTASMANLLATPVPAPKLSRPTVSQGVTGGRQLLHVQPQYPATARTMRLSGTVTMTVHIAKNGTVSAVKVISGHPLLNAAAVDAVRRWKYEPFQLNGQAIENDINVQVRFDIPR